MAKSIAVPFTRVLKVGMRGPDVRAVKRALVHQGSLKQRLGQVTPAFGALVQRALEKYQGNHDLPVTGTYTKETHSKLVAGQHFDAYGAHLMASFAQGSRGERVAQKISATAMFARARA